MSPAADTLLPPSPSLVLLASPPNLGFFYLLRHRCSVAKRLPPSSSIQEAPMFHHGGLGERVYRVGSNLHCKFTCEVDMVRPVVSNLKNQDFRHNQARWISIQSFAFSWCWFWSRLNGHCRKYSRHPA